MFAKNSAPQTRRAEFDKRFNEILQHGAPKQNTNNAFLLTPSRYPIRHQLDALLKLREKRPQGTNNAPKYGGLGGIILEGEPGIGKSELVIKTSVLNGYQEPHEKSVISNHLFYRMPVSWSVAEKEALLRHGRTGRINASKFNTDIQSKDTLRDVIDVIDALLTDENTRYETHSLASYILDGVGTVLPPYQLLLTHDRGHYSMKDWLWAKNLIPEQDGFKENLSFKI